MRFILPKYPEYLVYPIFQVLDWSAMVCPRMSLLVSASRLWGSIRAVPKMANYRPALILSYRHCVFNDFDYHPVVKTIYSARGQGRTTTSDAKLSR